MRALLRGNSVVSTTAATALQRLRNGRLTSAVSAVLSWRESIYPQIRVAMTPAKQNPMPTTIRSWSAQYLRATHRRGI